MGQPAVWGDDPECGHAVANPYQTHYCTYIRVPRLLTLQAPGAPDDLLLLTTLQWRELWLKVLLADLRAALAADPQAYEPVKLLRRGAVVFRLLDLQADLAEEVLVRELGLRSPPLRLAPPAGPAAPGQGARAVAVSGQLAELAALASHPDALAAGYPGLPEAAREYRARLAAFRARSGALLAAVLTPAGGGAEPAPAAPAPTYAEWLRLPELLSLQGAVKAGWAEEGAAPGELWAPERVGPDELAFVVAHQAFELWFRVVLDHLDRAIPLLFAGDAAGAGRILRRVVAIQRLLVAQIHLPATMTALDFLEFREQRVEREGRRLRTGLSPASGTESYQFREIEIVAGLRDDPAFQRYLQGSEQLPIRLLTPAQARRLGEPTLGQAFRRAVAARGVRRLEDLFRPSRLSNPNADLAELADTLVDFDEFFRFWRYHHVSMVEKMIGGKSGTGFLGPEYLMETVGLRVQPGQRVFEERQTRPRFFEDLWAVRTSLGEGLA